MSSFQAVVARAGEGKAYRVSLERLTREALPAQPGDALIEVAYSSLNYKDALAVTGRGKIIRAFPMVCGIDLAGTVVEPGESGLTPGDPVAIAGQGLGELRWGGYGRLASVSPSSVVRIPPGLDPLSAMRLGTAGYTAMLAVIALEGAGVVPGGKEIVVTGASGGVGSIAVMLLARLGFKVAASTGRPEQGAALQALGASTVLSRGELETQPPALGAERWAGAIDAVGGATLAHLLAHTQSFGAVAACGMAGGADFHSSVFPFILRNVSLLGVNSTQSPPELARRAWARLGELADVAKLEAISTVEPMSRIVELSEALLANRLSGRIVIDVTR
jgi:putative YhdH/YhfP family quinone oxidoreductase